MIGSLKHLSEINGKEILQVQVGECEGDFVDKETEHSICIDHGDDSIKFYMQTKPASSNAGLIGCHLTDLVEIAIRQLKYLNDKFPCRENALSITKFEEGLLWQRERIRNRAESTF